MAHEGHFLRQLCAHHRAAPSFYAATKLVSKLLIAPRTSARRRRKDASSDQRAARFTRPKRLLGTPRAARIPSVSAVHAATLRQSTSKGARANNEPRLLIAPTYLSARRDATCVQDGSFVALRAAAVPSLQYSSDRLLHTSKSGHLPLPSLAPGLEDLEL